MRPVDGYLALFDGSDALARKYALVQMERLAGDFETAGIVEFLSTVTGNQDVQLACQARRGLRHVLPIHYMQRYDLREETTTREPGTWTDYNIDGTEHRRMLKLGKAKRIDISTINPDELISSAVHLLEPCIGHAVRLATEGDPEMRLLAVRTLGQLAARESLETLAKVASHEMFALPAAGSIADLGTRKALDTLLRIISQHRTIADVDEILVELRSFDFDDACRALLSELSQAEPRRKANIALALGSFKTQEAEAALVGLLEDESQEVRLFAVDSLARVGTESCVMQVDRAFRTSTSGLVRQAAVRAFGGVGTADMAPMVAVGLKDEDPGVRGQALESLVRLRLPLKQLFKLAFPMVNDTQPTVSSSALLALAPIDTSTALHKLIGLFRQKDVRARAQGAFCLGYIQNSGALNVLRQVLQKDPSEVVTLQAVKAVSKYPRDDALRVLHGLLGHRHVSVRRMTARILSHLGSRGDRETFDIVVARLAAETETPVKTALLETLAKVAEPSAHETLEGFLVDRSPEVVAAAVEGLDILGNLDSVSAIEPCLTSNNASVKAQSALALWNHGETNVVERLATDLAATSSEQCGAALRALGAIGRSLGRLQAAAHKYPLLVSELSEHTKSKEYASAESVFTESMRIPSRVGAVDDSRSFDFQATQCAEDTSLRLNLSELGAEVRDAQGRPIELQLEGPLSLLAAGDTVSALPAIDGILRQTSALEARYVRACVFIDLGRLGEAELDLLAVVDGSPLFVNPLLLLASLARRQGQDRAAIPHLSKAVERSMALLQQQLETASGVLERGAAANLPPYLEDGGVQLPPLERMHELTGVLELVAGNHESAFRHFFLAHLAAPGSSQVSAQLAWAAAKVDRGDLALRLCRDVFSRTYRAEDLTADEMVARREALVSLGRLSPTQETFFLVRSLQKDTSQPDVQHVASKLFSEWKPRFAPDMPVEELQRPAVDALPVVAGQSKIEIAREAVMKLDKKALPQLLHSLSDENDPAVLTALVEAIGAIGEGSRVTWSTLQGYLKHPDARVRSATVEAMERVGDDLVWPVLVPLAQDPDDSVKRNAIKALLALHGEGTADMLRKLSRSHQDDHRENTCFCLGVLEEPWVQGILLKMIEAERAPKVLQKECELLAQRGDEECASFLVAELVKTEKPSRSAAVTKAKEVRGTWLKHALDAICARHSIPDDQIMEFQWKCREGAKEKSDRTWEPIPPGAVVDEQKADEEKPPRRASHRGPSAKRAPSRPSRGITVAAQAVPVTERYPWLLPVASLVVASVILGAVLLRTCQSTSNPELPTVAAPTSAAREEARKVVLVCRVLKIDRQASTLTLSRGKEYYLATFERPVLLSTVKDRSMVRVTGMLTNKKVGFARILVCETLQTMPSGPGQ